MKETSVLKEDEEFKDTNVSYLKVATGGKGPTDPNDPIWLKRYDVGTIFLAKRSGNPMLDFIILDTKISDKTYGLTVKGLGDVMVDPFEFCKVFRFQEVYKTAEETMAMVEAKRREENESTPLP